MEIPRHRCDLPHENRSTHIIAPGALIPGTWAAGQIPAERLVAPLVVMDLNPALANQPQFLSTTLPLGNRITA